MKEKETILKVMKEEQKPLKTAEIAEVANLDKAVLQRLSKS